MVAYIQVCELDGPAMLHVVCSCVSEAYRAASRCAFGSTSCKGVRWVPTLGHTPLKVWSSESLTLCLVQTCWGEGNTK